MSFSRYLRRLTSTAQIARKAEGSGIGDVDGKVYLNLSGSPALLTDSAVHTALFVGTKNGSTVSVAEYGLGGVFHLTVLTLTATPITLADATAGGGVKIYDFPQGAITILGGSFVIAPTTTSTLASTLNTGVTIEVGVGTATAGAGALTTSEEDIIEGSTGPASATINVAAAAIQGCRLATPAILDGTTTAIPMHVNIGVPTATDIDGDATLTLTGAVTVVWVYGGDK